MIHAESKKLHLIEFLIKENDESVLIKIENILKAAQEKPSAKFTNFSNTLSKEELDAFERNILADCR